MFIPDTIRVHARRTLSFATFRALVTGILGALSAFCLASGAAHAQTATTISLSIKTGGASGTVATSAPGGTVETLIATVQNTVPAAVTQGTVLFCDQGTTSTAPALTSPCRDGSYLGTAQLTSAGTATISLKLAPLASLATQYIFAKFVGTTTYSPSVTTSSSNPTNSTNGNSYFTVNSYVAGSVLSYAGTSAGYTLSDDIVGGPSTGIHAATAPSGSVSFTDTTSSTGLGTASLGTASQGIQAGTAYTYVDALKVAAATSPGMQNSKVIVTGDFNNDGIPDLVVFGTMTFAFLKGNGDGTFTYTPGTVNSTGSSALAAYAADFNGDGNLDIMTITSAGVYFMKGNGDGTFTGSIGTYGTYTSIATYATGSYPESLAVGDFNDDGILDFAVAYCLSSSGSCSGTETGDFIVYTGAVTSGTYSVSTATPAVTIAGPSGAGAVFAIVAADLNQDGYSDLAISTTSLTSPYYSNIYTYLNSGSPTPGTFSSMPSTTNTNVSNVSGAAQSVLSLAVTDLNNDGIEDILFPYNTHLGVMLGNSSSPGTSYSSPTAYSATNGSQSGGIAVGDFNGDGYPDVAVGCNASALTLNVFLNSGSGSTLNSAVNYALTGGGAYGIATGDFAGTGASDIATADDQTGWTINYAVGNGNYITFTVSVTEDLAVGQSVYITGLGTTFTSLNGTAVTITSTPSTTTFTVASTITGTETEAATIANAGAVNVFLTGQGAAATLSDVVITGSTAQNVNATYSNSAPYYASVASNTVVLADLTLTATGGTNANSATEGTSITLNAQESLISGKTPTGKVYFYSDSTLLGSATPNSSGLATLTTSALPAGHLTLSAYYTGDGNYPATTSAGLDFNVTVVTSSGTPKLVFINPPSSVDLFAGSNAGIVTMAIEDSSGNIYLPGSGDSITLSVVSNKATGETYSTTPTTYTATTSSTGIATYSASTGIATFDLSQISLSAVVATNYTYSGSSVLASGTATPPSSVTLDIMLENILKVTGYTDPPGSGATASDSISGGTITVNLTAGGSGFTTAPTLYFQTLAGTGCTIANTDVITTTINGGVVTGLNYGATTNATTVMITGSSCTGVGGAIITSGVPSNCTNQNVASPTTDANCRLRDALAFEGQSNTGATIQFNNNGTTTPQTITLGANLLTVPHSGGIVGPGPEYLTINGAGLYSIFTSANSYFVLSGMTLANGYSNASGAAISSTTANLSVNDVAFIGNYVLAGPLGSTQLFGGAIYENSTAGVMNISNSTFINNSDGVTPNVFITGVTAPAPGGTTTSAIFYTSGPTNFMAGGTDYVSPQGLASTSCGNHFNNPTNSSTGYPITAVSNTPPYSFTVSSSSLVPAATCSDSGDTGVAYLVNGAGGGAIATGNATSDTAKTTITNSTFYGNSSFYGGAISLTNGTSASPAATATISNSTFYGNSSVKYGSAIYLLADTVTLLNDTIVGNTSTYAGDYNGAVGENGTATNNAVSTTLYNSIVADNTAGGRSPDLGWTGGGTATVSGNTYTSSSTYNSYTYDSTNVIGGLNTATSSYPSLASLGLAPLGYYGGSTNTDGVTPNVTVTGEVANGTTIVFSTSTAPAFTVGQVVYVSGLSAASGCTVLNNQSYTLTAVSTTAPFSFTANEVNEEMTNSSTQTSCTSTGTDTGTAFGSALSTMALLPGSILSGKGTNSNAPSTDERGFVRDAGSGDAGALQSNLALTVGTVANQTAGVTFTPSPTATLTESSVYGLSGVSVTASLSAGILGGTQTATTNSSGVATFASLVSDTAETGIKLIADAGPDTLTGSSGTFNIVAGPVAQLTFVTAPATPITAGGNAGSAVTVKEQDAYGNLSGPDLITLTVTGPSGYSQTHTATAVNGIATFNLSTFPLNTAGTYSYVATVGAVTSPTATEVVTVGAVSALTASFSAATLGVASTVTVTAVDAGGNTVTTFPNTDAVTLTSSTDPTAIFSAPADLTSGVGTFTVTFDNVGASQTVTATAATGGYAGTSSATPVNDPIWLVNSNGTLDKISAYGTQLSGAVGMSGSTSGTGSVGFDSAGNVWSVTSANNTLNFATKTGASTGTYSGGGLSGPVSVGVDGAGYIWIANSGNASVSAFNNSGTAVSPSVGYGTSGTAAIGTTPSSIAIDNSGGVWVTSSSANSVTHIVGVATPITTPTATAVANGKVGVTP